MEAEGKPTVNWVELASVDPATELKAAAQIHKGLLYCAHSLGLQTRKGTCDQQGHSKKNFNEVQLEQKQLSCPDFLDPRQSAWHVE